MEQILIWQIPLTEEILMQQEIDNLKIRQDNLRRGLFARIEELKKEMGELRQKLIDKENLWT